ncbi:hypothetical protein [Chitinophaga sancti]|uniref:Uncharacterized protein n=1 Tax=Chitinophaga sancti TaxID=1004 RepID=A0A1K1RMY4_9BACT|nr:hypothetical protein [Chitinophaga sancti]WQD62642.1 hypothetical protein U0033_32625 [Chitinophaga sancti]WQG91735.1 hypothetical protein SR876_09480 [Chitinophaga sancti]SFW73282.1 hypothetical protein SAMN05661012_03986 [Chitinophaga sancti]
MRKAIIILLSLFLSAIIIVTFLVQSAPLPNKVRNGFDRTILPASFLTPLGNMPTGDSIQLVSGATPTQIFLSTTDPTLILSTDYHFKQSKRIKLALSKGLIDSLQRYFFTIIDSPFVHIYAYNLPAIITLPLSGGPAQVFRLPPGGYSKAYAIAPDQFILRKLDRKISDQQFLKVNTSTSEITVEKNLSTLHQDGGMSTDGSLTYDTTGKKLVYTYFYLNQYFSFDTSLQKLQEGHTIDTSTHSRFQLAEATARNENVLTRQGPDQLVNNTSFVYNGKLFIHSLLKGDHEQAGKFSSNSAIDKYDLHTNQYQGSFYLPVRAEKVRHIYIFNDKMVIEGRDYIYSYVINTRDSVLN